ncbi:hypothetical protein NM688_g6470 [Phlebia brevispora]|uniref:Uncharacterized protein n=1 Tax=Phlebia brevispora TaxID=194682 RepID=A0ACC1SFU3_9APHY|nr:hypothetical protein NM688_g6470 [Phlebia brevispora]
MPRFSKPLTVAQLEDVTLGAFAYVPTSETINHFIRYVSTWSGNDKLFMIIQYSLKLIVPFLHLRARLQHRSGLRAAPTSGAADRLAKFGSLIGDYRMLSNMWGLLPIIQWLTSLERKPPPTRKLHTIERLQGWSMLLYYPMEHVYWLLVHSIIPSTLSLPSLASKLRPSALKSERKINLDAGVISRVSTRFWAVYVVLQFLHLSEDSRLLRKRERAVNKSKAISASAEKEEIKKRWDALNSEFFVALGYLPLTIHWSLEKGLFQNEVWVGVFGLIAALAGWRSGWKATALPPSPQSTPMTLEADAEERYPASEDSSLDLDIVNPAIGLEAGLDEI